MEVGGDGFENFGKTVWLLPVIPQKTFGGLIEPARTQKAFAEEREECGVLFVGRKRFEKLDGAFGVALAKPRLGEQKRAGTVVRCKPVGIFKIFDGLIERAGGLRELAGANKAARRKIGMTKAGGELGKSYVARGAIRLEHGHALVAGQRFDAAPLLLEDRRSGRILLDRFAGAALALQKRAIAHQAVRRLRKLAQKARVDGCRFR